MIYTNARPFEVKKLEDVCFYSTMMHDSSGKNIDPRLLVNYFNTTSIMTTAKWIFFLVLSDTLTWYIYQRRRNKRWSRYLTALSRPPCFTMKNRQSIRIYITRLSRLALCYFIRSIKCSNRVQRPVDNTICSIWDQLLAFFKWVVFLRISINTVAYGSIRSIFNFLKGLRKLNEIQRNENLVILSLWRNEIFSTIGCQLTRYSDLNWLECSVDELIKEVIYQSFYTQLQKQTFFNLKKKNKTKNYEFFKEKPSLLLSTFLRVTTSAKNS